MARATHPLDYVGLILCDTRRAASWRVALARAGITARVVETIGDEAEDGACKVSVPRRDLPAANAMVTAVTRGELVLPGAGAGRARLIAVTMIVIAALLAALSR